MITRKKLINLVEDLLKSKTSPKYAEDFVDMLIDNGVSVSKAVSVGDTMYALAYSPTDGYYVDKITVIDVCDTCFMAESCDVVQKYSYERIGVSVFNTYVKASSILKKFCGCSEGKINSWIGNRLQRNK